MVAVDPNQKKTATQIKKMTKLAEQLAKEKQRSLKLKATLLQQKSKKAIRRSPGAPRVKRAQSVWVKALLQWNTGKDTYRIPKKGSGEHNEVMAIKQKLLTSGVKDLPAGLNVTEPADLPGAGDVPPDEPNMFDN